MVSTREQIRTATPLPAPAPQAGASTNFATRVSGCKYIFIQFIIKRYFKILDINYHPVISQPDVCRQYCLYISMFT